MKNIFVTYEIAIKLNEIGFDEPCVGLYVDRDEDGDLFGGWKIFMEIDKLSYRTSINLTDDFQLFDYNNVGWISVPTYEQVFKWFREKGIMGYVKPFADTEKYNFVIGDRDYFDVVKSFEQARELLILEMIEIYKRKRK